MKNLIKIDDNLWIPHNFDTVHSYFSDEGGTKRYTGVTTVLGVIAKPALIGWAADMAVDYIIERQSLAPEVLEEAREAHTRRKESAGARGTDVHALVENYIKACIETNGGIPSQMQTEDLMVSRFIDWSVHNQVRFLASEKRVYSKDWWCAGTFDFSFEKDGKRYIGDLKTMKKMWDRTPHFQCAAYMKMSTEMGEAPYDGSCIVNINKESAVLTDYWTYDHENDRKAFESALFLHRQLSNF